MSFVAFGVEVHPSKKTIEVNGALSQLSELREIAESTSTKELFPNVTKSRLEMFAFTQQPDALEKECVNLFKNEVSNFDEKDCFGDYQQEAVQRFLRTAAGLDGELQLAEQEKPFHDHFLRARQAELIGPYFNKLYQRGLWLSEKIRIELNQQFKAVSRESVVTELASKIFGKLGQRSALIVSATMACEKHVEALKAKGLTRFRFVNLDSHTTAALCAKYSGASIETDSLQEVLLSSDLILECDTGAQEILHKHSFSKLMERRKNAPLLFVSLVETEPPFREKDFSKSGNLYYYGKRDLDKIVSSGQKEKIRVRDIAEKLIEREATDFLNWINSNEPYRFGDIIGKSEAMQRIMELIARIAQTDISVLIDGESGTGKELVARSIHEHSLRVHQPFIAVNCGAIPESLLESELFGYVRGAFTGATGDKKGLLKEADRGTIFLDEIGEMSAATQVKLLRFLQDGEIRPVGSNELIRSDARVLAATNKDLEEEVAEEKFRQDLFYRLNVIQLTIAPLRERREDILPLAHFFIKKYSDRFRKKVTGLSEEAKETLLAYRWPGNIRELENAIERAVALATSTELSQADLPPVLSDASQPGSVGGFQNMSLKELEKKHILATLQANDWNYELVTQILGIGRTTLWRKMKEYEIASPQAHNGKD